MKLKLLSLAAALLAFGAPAQALVVHNTFKPNFYSCTAKDISLSFYVKPNAKTSELEYLTIGKQSYTDSGDQIETSTTPFGDVKTIFTEFLPDVYIKKASFVIPTIELGQNVFGQYTDQVKFKSELILTTVVTPFIIGPYIGVVNDSKYISLNCIAKFAPTPIVIPLN
jgi:hypothetical protein